MTILVSSCIDVRSKRSRRDRVAPLRRPGPRRILRRAFSRVANEPKQYVQNRIRARSIDVARMVSDADYVCGLKDMETGVDQAFHDACRTHGVDWDQGLPELRRRAATASKPIEGLARRGSLDRLAGYFA